MKVRPDREMKDLLVKLGEANGLMKERRWEEARKIYLHGRSYARKRKLPYGELAWCLCVCLDNLGEVEAAFRMAVEAVDQDPFSPQVRESFHVVARRLGDKLAATVEDPATPARYALLAENDAAESADHLAMAKHLIFAGEPSHAAELLEALTTLAPNLGEPWRLRAQLARSQGLEEEAERMEFEALAIENAVAAGVEVR